MPPTGITQASRQQPRGSCRRVTPTGGSVPVAARPLGGDVFVDLFLGREPVVEFLAGGEPAALSAPVGSFGDSCFATLRERRNLATLQFGSRDLGVRGGLFCGGRNGLLGPARAGAGSRGHGVRLRGAPNKERKHVKVPFGPVTVS